MLSPDAVLKSAIQNHLAGRHLDASKQYKLYLRWRPGDPAASYNLSILLKSSGDAAGAIELLRSSHLANPEQLDLSIHLAVLLSESEEYEKAIVAYRNAAILAPTDINIFIRGALPTQKDTSWICVSRLQDARSFSSSFGPVLET